ncbi:MAG: hypothetical protein QT08_C0020G0034 [archaeon GW2011_AR17]|nr:MAG: hypothetical protein QT08_C0020G0034 [archaeon GW2011_AR17]MBS3154045.1 hypothetical protein [Candidatus Woesearchaeota archaeon]HIH15565.1 hypothetical protein [Nanoarchaeota archaeon]HIH59103.1 hypothetical protein [Nanoarchaeota archaeon]HII14609.1 hypothetical protein [Nanoarchaeota archaeon]
MIREEFLKLYANLPVKLREEVILVLDKEGPITWNSAYFEINNKTKLGEIILKKLKELRIL